MFSIEGTEQEVHDPGAILDVELIRRDGEGFGFNIIGGIDSNEFGSHNGIFISQINPGGPAYKCGHLDVGDRLLEVNGLNLIAIKHGEAVDSFRKAGNVVNLKVEKFGQQLLVAKLSTDMVDAPYLISNSTGHKTKNFLNSWAGAILFGAAAGMIAMFTFTKLYRYK